MVRGIRAPLCAEPQLRGRRRHMRETLDRSAGSTRKGKQRCTGARRSTRSRPGDGKGRGRPRLPRPIHCAVGRSRNSVRGVARLITTENPSRDVARLLRYWASADFVAPRLRARHPGLTAERARSKAQQTAVHIAQGLEFLEAASGATVLTQPLPLFYAAENMVKGLCVFLDRSVDNSSFQRHGLSGQHTRRYFIRTLCCRVQAPGRSVWSVLFDASNSDRVRVRAIRPDGTHISMDIQTTYDTKPLRSDSVLRLGDLLRHLPEVAEDSTVAGWGHPFSVHAPTAQVQFHAGESEEQTVKFKFRHAHQPNVRDMIIARERDLLRGYTRSADHLDVMSYTRGPETGIPILPLSPRRLRRGVGRLWSQHAGVRRAGHLLRGAVHPFGRRSVSS